MQTSSRQPLHTVPAFMPTLSSAAAATSDFALDHKPTSLKIGSLLVIGPWNKIKKKTVLFIINNKSAVNHAALT